MFQAVSAKTMCLTLLAYKYEIANVEKIAERIMNFGGIFSTNQRSAFECIRAETLQLPPLLGFEGTIVEAEQITLTPRGSWVYDIILGYFISSEARKNAASPFVTTEFGRF